MQSGGGLHFRHASRRHDARALPVQTSSGPISRVHLIVGLWNATGDLNKAEERVGCGATTHVVGTLAAAQEKINGLLQPLLIRTEQPVQPDVNRTALGDECESPVGSSFSDDTIGFTTDKNAVKARGRAGELCTFLAGSRPLRDNRRTPLARPSWTAARPRHGKHKTGDGPTGLSRSDENLKGRRRRGKGRIDTEISGVNHESYRSDPCRGPAYRPVWRRLRLPQR